MRSGLLWVRAAEAADVEGTQAAAEFPGVGRATAGFAFATPSKMQNYQVCKLLLYLNSYTEVRTLIENIRLTSYHPVEVCNDVIRVDLSFVDCVYGFQFKSLISHTQSINAAPPHRL